MRAGARRVAPLLKGAVGFVLALALVELVVRVGLVSNKLMPPTRVIGKAAELIAQGDFRSQVGSTLQACAVGLAISAAAGIAAGIALGISERGYRASRGLIEFLRPIPSVALVPLAILVFGLTMKMRTSLVIYATFWPILISTAYGVRNTDRTMIDSARVFEVPRWRILLRVVLPAAAPLIASGIRVAASIALLLAVTAEMVAGSQGLGFVIANAQGVGQTDVMYAGIFVAGAIGILINLGLRMATDRLLFWRSDRAAPARGPRRAALAPAGGVDVDAAV